MLELIYEKAFVSKVKIVKHLLENGGISSKEKVIEVIDTSWTTMDKYLYELSKELPLKSIKIYKNSITINPKLCNLYDVQMNYLSKSIVKDVLTYIFFERNLTLESMAQSLYVSNSKLFKILKFLKVQLKKIGIEVIRSPYI
ncbi:helix-turn-helix domain-containing protein, partial [Enterococcus faecium]|uniref:helix-turn-helix domain-containing protein n=1 Tax=Enterococcus faecium TaxID=1352 RepID=UPI0023B21DC3